MDNNTTHERYIPYDKLHNIVFDDERWSKVVYYMERIMGGELSYKEKTQSSFSLSSKGRVAIYSYPHDVCLVAPTGEVVNIPKEFFLRLHEQILAEFRNIYG